MGICQNLSFSSILQKMLTLKQPLAHQAHFPSPLNQTHNYSTMRLACTPNSTLTKEVHKNIKRSAASHEKTASDATLIKSVVSSKMLSSNISVKRMKSKLPCYWELMKDESIELTSPNVGLKVRKLKRQGHKFHKNFKRDQILHFFANQPIQQMKSKTSRIFQIRNLDRSKYRKCQIIQNKPTLQQVEDQLQSEKEVATEVIQPPFSSNLSGWRAESSEQTNQTTALQEECEDPVRYVQRMPSINLGMSQRENSYRATDEDQIEMTADEPQEEDQPDYTQESSMLQLPEQSLKLVPPSESSCQQSPVSINIKNESQSEVPLRQLSQNTVSHQAIQTKSSKPKLPSKLSLKNIFNFPSKEQIKEKTSKISIKPPQMQQNDEQQSVKLAECILTNDIAGFSYKVDDHSHQKADQSDKIRLTEREMNSYRFQSPKKTIQTKELVKANIKQQRKRSIVVEKIEEFGQNCKNFFTNVAAVLNPMKIFTRQNQIDPIDQECTANECQEESLMDSVPILHTLNSKVGSQKYFKNEIRDHQVSIREATMQMTQGWCNQNNNIFQRQGTFHEMKMPSHCYMTEMRINLMAKDFNNQSFYSEISIDIDIESIKQIQHIEYDDLKAMRDVETQGYLIHLAEDISEQVTARSNQEIREIVNVQIDALEEEILDEVC